jgi:hypothetical protein
MEKNNSNSNSNNNSNSNSNSNNKHDESIVTNYLFSLKSGNDSNKGNDITKLVGFACGAVVLGLLVVVVIAMAMAMALMFTQSFSEQQSTIPIK